MTTSIADTPVTPAAPKPQTRAHVLAVFRAHDQGDGTLRRGWKTAAVTALNYGRLPTGKVFQRLGEQADVYFDTYFTSPQPEMAPIPRMAASK